MLLEIAVGDALGAGYEFNDPAIERHKADLLHGYVQHAKHVGITPGMYTDDTQMSIGTAAALISGEPWEPKTLVRHWLAAFHRDRRDGYARGFQAFLESHDTVEAFLADIRPDSDRSGAAMRVGPVGLIADPARVVEMATVQAEVTHRTPGGVASAVAAALVTWYCFHTTEPKKDLPAFLAARVPGYGWDQRWTGRVSVTGTECVAAALTAVVECDSLSAILTHCIRYGGDVDTAAAIAMAAASGSREIRQDLPQHLLDGLENGSYGRDYLVSLDEKLRAATLSSHR
ncbi:ADP-ribosylation/Crystallin J1 OS=Microcoleus vaginatus FGP-2 GN=MicvaDRAFT_1116 PE=4 SV=1: ADP_ribosyl_GH [Gemmata massiliana]|uniref:ADP-ribosylglycohydrolase n=1 Tax=Gemmata massiliana TaxID=1210884 RepID=A0A6P2CUQ7_9BACT|nr:ADP-ribosylglycohydrolase family protein [Gemmata massiliana]VTR91424.1 ADP-ribosylation/Crystallin J1 OS=Microcoleus vaginatus FGP-2 GN=MicvaDRAFT_1116 PE=4 SV=1: ADP_ribosyl_GH [Gemmata massiliana]